MSALSRRSILRATAATSALALAPSAGHAGSPPDPTPSDESTTLVFASSSLPVKAKA
jgi:hypothetical protein